MLGPKGLSNLGSWLTIQGDIMCQREEKQESEVFLLFFGESGTAHLMGKEFLSHSTRRF